MTLGKFQYLRSKARLKAVASLPCMNRVEFGDCRDTMRAWAAAGVKAQMCVTSPPYFGLRSYAENLVQIDPSLSPEKRAWLVAELDKRGIHARG